MPNVAAKGCFPRGEERSSRDGSTTSDTEDAYLRATARPAVHRYIWVGGRDVHIGVDRMERIVEGVSEDNDAVLTRKKSAGIMNNGMT